MLWEGRGIGAIMWFACRRGLSPRRRSRLLKTFADQAVIAIENTRLFSETNEALERQTATAEILAVISESPTDVQPVFQAIAERARTLCKADVGATTRLDGDVVHLAGVRALSTQAEDAMRAAFPMAVDAAPPNIRRAIVEQQPVQIADVHAEPGYPSAEVAQRSGFRSILSVPLLHQGRSIGTIGVARREPGRFADGAVALLQTFARQAVIAIENVRLFNETKEALRAADGHGRGAAGHQQLGGRRAAGVREDPGQLPRPVRRRPDGIAAARRRRASCTSAPARHRSRRANWPRCPAPAEHDRRSASAIRERRRLHFASVLNDAGRAPTACGPWRERGTRTSRSPWRRWSGRDEASARIVVGRAGAAARSPTRSMALLRDLRRPGGDRDPERAPSETQEALEHQTATSEVLNVIAASVDDAQPVFDKIIDSAAQLFPDALALMILQTDAQDMLHVAGIRFVGDASGPFSPEAARQRERAIAQAFPSPLAGTATELAIRTGLADIPDMQNATEVPGLQRFAKIIGFNFAALFAPLMWEGKGIGSIAMLSSRLGPFGDRERALIKTFADQAVIAIQNARLFNETKEALERQTATAEILAGHQRIAHGRAAGVRRHRRQRAASVRCAAQRGGPLRRRVDPRGRVPRRAGSGADPWRDTCASATRLPTAASRRPSCDASWSRYPMCAKWPATSSAGGDESHGLPQRAGRSAAARGQAASAPSACFAARGQAVQRAAEDAAADVCATRR